MKDFLKITLLWLVGVISYLILMAFTSWWMPFVISLFTKDDKHGRDHYTWGSWWGTFDNPPQGDEGYVKKHAPYIPPKNAFQRYINRVGWLRRNRLYNWKYKFSVVFKEGMVKTLKGNPDISDKYKVPGYLLTKVHYKGRLKAWEWYSVTPYSKRRNLRIRLGWKIKGDKFDEPGERVQLVFTINPFDGYGNK